MLLDYSYVLVPSIDLLVIYWDWFVVCFHIVQRWFIQSGAGQHGRWWDVLQQGKICVCTHTHTHTPKHVIDSVCMNAQQTYCDCVSSQKRTWESNKNDIRVCRMKGKHEVKSSYTTTLWFWNALIHASTLSRLSHAWTDTTAVIETLFPLGAPAHGIYTNLMLLIQDRLIT